MASRHVPAFMLDTLTLAHGHASAAAFSNLFAQNAVGFALVWTGYDAALMLR